MTNTSLQAPHSLREDAVVWTPSAPHTTQMWAFHDWIAQVEPTAGLKHLREYASTRDGYRALHAWSVEQMGRFWPRLAEFCNIAPCTFHAIKPNQTAISNWSPGKSLLDASFFEGIELNYAEETLRHGHPDAMAILAFDEHGQRAAITYAELRQHVRSFAATLKHLNVRPGDRVCALVGNIPAAVVGYLACATIGAVWTACSPEFGVDSVLARFQQVTPKVILAIKSYTYKGKEISVLERVAEVVGKIASIEAVIGVDLTTEHFSKVGRHVKVVAYHEAIATPPLDHVRTFGFRQPLAILYTSGTTGAPKCIVHGAGGALLNLAKEHILHCDARAGDRVFYYTTTSWMMWNWLVGGLFVGETLILYDGHPTHPHPDSLWALGAAQNVSLFGTSAAFIDMARQADWRLEGSWPALRTIASTGSPLLADNFDYVYRAIKRDVHLASISGGTDIMGCFMMGCPTLPLRRGELQVATLGNDVAVFNDHQQPVTNMKGNMVVRRPFVNMPVQFWSDPEAKLYKKAYFQREDGTEDTTVWSHGDFVETTNDGAFVIYGRSDATLNPGGVRIGTSEIYQVVLSFPQIHEVAVVGYSHKGNDIVIMLVVLEPAHAPLSDGRVSLPEALQADIQKTLRTRCSPRHVPHAIYVVPALPKTFSGKLSELAIKRSLEGHTHAGQSLRNPEALEILTHTIRPLILASLPSS